jgi:hypothetical protein
MKDERSRAALEPLYPSSFMPDQVGLSAYFRDLTNQKSPTVRCFSGFRHSFSLYHGPAFDETAGCIKVQGLDKARDHNILRSVFLPKHFSYGQACYHHPKVSPSSLIVTA